jgi:hypothetical protein
MTITDPEFSTNVLSAILPKQGGAHWWLPMVYGMQDDVDKIAFIIDLWDICASCSGPWMLCADFNLIYRDEDKKNENLNRRMMGRLCHVINGHALKEVYMNGRRYTWSNEQTPWTLVHVNRVLCTSD